MTDPIAFLTAGLVFGLSAGFAPGPLTALVIAETLRHNAVEGAKVACAPLLTDAPIILGIYFILSRLPDINTLVGIISLCGAGFLTYLGVQSFRFRGTDVEVETAPARSIRKGVLVNVFNPNPYLFWFTVGAPTIAKALTVNFLALGLFFGGFYALLVGGKMLLAFLTGRSRAFLNSTAYVWIMRGLGMMLLVYAALFLISGLRDLGVVFSNPV